MKCPYRNFEECIVQECPACNYKENKEEVTVGIIPARMSREKAIDNGFAWEEIKTTYEFVSCKLIEDSVQPIPSNKEVVNNTIKKNVTIKKGIVIK